MIFRKVLARIKSLEEHLGVVYAPDGDYAEHVNRKYGEIPQLLEDVKALKEKKGKK